MFFAKSGLTQQVKPSVHHLIVGPEAGSAGIDSNVRSAIGWCSEAIGCAAETESSSVGWETHQEELSWRSQCHPVGHRGVLREMTW